MKKEIKEYLEIVNRDSVKHVNGIEGMLEEYAGTHEDLTTDEIEGEIWGYICDEVEDSNQAFDLSQTPRAMELLKMILSDLEDYQEKEDREYEEEREAMNRAYRHAKGFN